MTLAWDTQEASSHRNGASKVQEYEGGVLAARHSKVAWHHTVGILARCLDVIGLHVQSDMPYLAFSKKWEDRQGLGRGVLVMDLEL